MVCYGEIFARLAEVVDATDLKSVGYFDLGSSSLPVGSLLGGNMKWTDVEEIVSSLRVFYPDLDPASLRFVTLKRMIVALDGFDDVHEHCNERVLEAIQTCWLSGEYSDEH